MANRYRLGPSIGRGGMGEVFRATDEQLGRTVAVKLLLPTDHDARAAERFHREARAAARLHDPHVVSVYDFGHHGDGFFLVMEYVDSRTVAEELAEHLAEHGPLPMDRAIDIVEQAAAGLAAAHREDVVHRDVKPANLLLAADGTVKVADFGIAQVPGDGATTLTGTGQIIGSTHYLAPERARGGAAGAAADVYSLGCVLYQLVTGQPPFTAEIPTAILYQHVDAAPSPPSLVRPELAGPFEATLLRMLAKDPAARPTAAQLSTGLLRGAPSTPTWPIAVIPPDTSPGPPVDTPPVLPAGAAPVPPFDTPAVVPPGAPPTPGSSIGGPPVEAPRDLQAAADHDRSRRTALLAGVFAVLAIAAAATTGIILNDDNPRLPSTTDVGPRPSVSPSTPTAPKSTQATVANQPNPTTSDRTTRRPTTQATPSSTPSPTTTPTRTPTPEPSPSAPPQSSTTPSNTPTSSEPTGTPDTPTTSETPSPDPDGTTTPPG